VSRLAALLALVLAGACSPAPAPDGDGPVVPLGGWGDDDDDAAEEPPEPVGNVPVSPDSETFSLEPCTVGEVLGAGCTELPHAVVRAPVGEACPQGERVVHDGDAWADLADLCGLDDEAGADVDWEHEVLYVQVDEGVGCGCSHDVLWVVECDDGLHVGTWFHPCGPCDDVLLRLTAATAPRDGGDAALHACTPYDVICVN